MVIHNKALTKFTPTAIDYHPSMGDMEMAVQVMDSPLEL